MTKLAQIIRHKLKEKRLSAHALEKLAGLRSSAVHNILQGRSKNPTLQTLQAISSALDCSMQELVDNAENPAKQSDIEWDFALYEKAVQLTYRLFQEHNINLNKQKTLAYIDEIYNYSLSANIDDIDQRFAEWLLNKVT